MNIQRGRGGEGGSARRGSLQPEPHDARRRQREPPEPRETGSGRRAPGVGAACSAPRSPCSPRDASPPRPPRRAPPCGRRRRCHVPGEARGGRSGDSADGLEEAEAEAAAGGGELGARARAHGGARLARPGHVPGRAGYEAGGAGGAATSALARAALGAAVAAAAVSSGPGERPGARAGRDWHPRHLPPAPACGARARARGEGPSPHSPPPGGLAGGSRVGLARRRTSPFPGCPVPEGGQRAPGSRGAQCLRLEAPRAPGHLWPVLPGAVPVWPAQLARRRWPEGVCVSGVPGAERGRPGLQGPRGWAERLRRRRASGAGRGARRGVSGPGGTIPVKSSHPGERGPLAGVPPADVSSRGSSSLPWGLFRARWAPAQPPRPCVLASLFR